MPYRVFSLFAAIAAIANAFHFTNPATRTITTTATNRYQNLALQDTRFDLIKEKYSGRLDLTSMKDEDDGDLGIASHDFFIEADDEAGDPPKVGQTITGTVIEMDEKGALLEIGGKMSGYLPIKEASLLSLRHMSEVVEIGQEISAEVIGTLRGMPVISFRTEQLVKAWEEILKVKATDEPFMVKVSEVNRGGAVCDCFGLKAFLPGSHYQGMPDESLIGQTLSVKFLDVIEEEGKIVVSQRLAVTANVPDLNKGEVMDATVTGLRAYGAFLELDGGQAGLLHISQISYDRVDNLEELFKIGQRMKVMILEHDKVKGRVALSTKNLERQPGEMLRDMNAVFENAHETAKEFHARNNADRLAREEAAKEIVASLSSAMEGGEEGAAGSTPEGGNSESDELVSVSESIESILASIVADAPNENA